MSGPAFCDLVHIIGIYTGLDDREIRLGVEGMQVALGNDISPEYAAMVYGRSLDVPVGHWAEICYVNRPLTADEIRLLETPAAIE